jgi:hypothetical protein
VPTPSPSASAQPSARASNALCLLTQLVPGTRCVTTAECYDALAVSGGVASAPKVACTSAHTWEAYGLVDLPNDVAGVDYQSVKSNVVVRKACNSGTLTLLDFNLATWQVDVLPPTAAAFASGERTVRCLAGPGSGQQSTGSKFGS